MLKQIDETVAKIIQDDDPILKQISQPVTEFDEELLDLVAAMFNSMVEYQGIGLSAVQIGVLKRVLIAAWQGEILVMVNPEIIRTLNRFVVEEEGCLSIPRSRWRPVSRPGKCEIKWRDPQGLEHTRNFSGKMARIIQHEMDHLDGILITDKPMSDILTAALR